MEKIKEIILNDKILISIIIIILGIILNVIFKKMMKRMINKNKNNDKLDNRKRTYIRLGNSIIKYVIIIMTVILVLKVNGVNVTSIVAGLGLVSVIAGLALQDALKDIIMGFNLIVDDYFHVGDILKIGEINGKVIQLGLKSTKLKDIYTGNTLVIANRNIGDALSISNQLDIDIPLPYERKIDDMENLINEIMSIAEQLRDVKNIEYKGIQEFGDSAIYYKIRIFCAKPEYKFQVKRDINGIIKRKLDEKNVSMPYTQIDIHNIK